jgi:hypothetical protein
LLPFFIEWSRDSAHPSMDAPSGCRLARFSVSSNEPEALRGIFGHLGVNVTVEKGSEPKLRARISSAKGTLELTS